MQWLQVNTKGEESDPTSIPENSKWDKVSRDKVNHKVLGLVVQSVVSLTSSLRVISLTVLADSIHNILIFFAEKMWVAFALQKLLTFFQQKISEYCVSLDVNFNESLTNDIVSFEQLGPDIFLISPHVCCGHSSEVLWWGTSNECASWRPSLQEPHYMFCGEIRKIFSWIPLLSRAMSENVLFPSVVLLELSEREKFCDNFRISKRSFGPNFGFPYLFYTFSFLPQLKIGRIQPA